MPSPTIQSRRRAASLIWALGLGATAVLYLFGVDMNTSGALGHTATIGLFALTFLALGADIALRGVGRTLRDSGSPTRSATP